METTPNGFVPVLPVRNTVVFPGLSLPLRVGRAKSISAVEKSQLLGSWLVVVSQKNDPSGQEPSPEDLYRVGTLAKVEKIRGNAESGYQILIRGVARYRIEELEERDGHLRALGEAWNDSLDADPKTNQALLQSLKTLGREILELLPSDTAQLSEMLAGIDDLVYLSHLCSGNMELDVATKQALLETVSIRARVLKLLDLMQKQKDELQVRGEIRDKLAQKLGKNQREAILREQLRTIREELGEGDEAAPEDDLRGKIDAAGMPADVKKVALDELKRFEAIGPQSPESHVIRNYLDLLCAMPWSKSSDASIDLARAREILDREHYGLEPIKKRILQHLAVMKLKQSGRGSILLFVGPPGVGKTSLGQSIARALGRKFARGSLGGVRDDSEIRGHRRTYIGAMPGRIVQGIKRAGENNPVFMLDEIDKLSRSFQGDPASALLEVLDPEQNATFLDHYLDVPFDLSKVFFVATANSLDTIPAPLLDRMEIIELSGYTTAEKLHIAKNHLIPKQLTEHGITPAQLAIGDEALLRIITHYTREAGVRDLERKIAAVARASTERVLSATTQPSPSGEGSGSVSELPIRVELADLEEILGAERYVHEVAERVTSPGVVTGLAWTPQGGEILFIEATKMPGSGRLTITGQLGEVMKESAQIALSLVRSNLAALVPGFEFEKNDIHIHVPAGAIPKDGPSAGITMVTTIASLFSGKGVSPTLAMTGEVTLRGAVMPVGGIKEKVIAAHRAGIERVIMSRRNERDLKDVPEEVRSALRFEFVEHVSEVLRLALGLQLGGSVLGLAPMPDSGASPAVA